MVPGSLCLLASALWWDVSSWETALPYPVPSPSLSFPTPYSSVPTLCVSAFLHFLMACHRSVFGVIL